MMSLYRRTHHYLFLHTYIYSYLIKEIFLKNAFWPIKYPQFLPEDTAMYVLSHLLPYCSWHNKSWLRGKAHFYSLPHFVFLIVLIKILGHLKISKSTLNSRKNISLRKLSPRGDNHLNHFKQNSGKSLFTIK